jgi:glucokinase
VATLAADFGGTSIKLGVVREGQVLARNRLPAHADRPMAERLEAVAESWQSMVTDLSLPLAKCDGVGLSLPFLMDPKQPRVLGVFHKYPGAPDIDFGKWARDRLGLPVAIENDLRMALLGEWSTGAAYGHDDAVMIAFGSGIGCAALLNGRLVRGSHHRGGTLLAHTTIAVDSDPGRCGNIGCAEDMACTATLAQVAHAMPGFEQSRLRGADPLDYEAVFRLADEGDAVSQLVVERSLRVWATIALTAAVAYDPSVLVLGGGVMARHEIVIPTIQEHIARFRPGIEWDLSIVPSQLGDDAALIGCEWLLRNETLGHG